MHAAALKRPASQRMKQVVIQHLTMIVRSPLQKSQKWMYNKRPHGTQESGKHISHNRPHE